MFENLFKQDATIHRYRAAPLARSRLDYLVHRAGQGASRSTLQRIAADQVAATRYLKLGQERKIQPSALEGAAQRWAAECPERRNRNNGKPRRLFFGRVAAWLRFAGLWEVGEAAAHPYEDELKEFMNYMREQHGWSEVTIRVYRGRVGEFLIRFGCENGPLACITVADIDRQIAAKGTREGCRRSARSEPTRMRCGDFSAMRRNEAGARRVWRQRSPHHVSTGKWECLSARVGTMSGDCSQRPRATTP